MSKTERRAEYKPKRNYEHKFRNHSHGDQRKEQSRKACRGKVAW